MSNRNAFWLPTIYREEEGGGGGGDPPAFAASLPETMRGHEAFKDVKDVGDLAGRYVTAITPKPFADQLPDDIKGEAAFADIKDLAGLAKSYHHAQKLIGVPKDQILRVPADDKKESWDPIYTRLGRPEKADDYKITVPEGLAVDEGFLKSMRGTMHEAGLSQKQVDAVYGKYFESVKGALDNIGTQQKTAQDNAAATLKADWGAAYGEKLEGTKAVIAQLDKMIDGKGALAKDLEATNLGNHPALAKAFDKLAQMFKEDGIIGRATGSDALNSPTEARQQIAKRQQDQAFMARYMTRGAAGHQEAVEEMRLLYEQASPPPQQSAA